MRILSVDIDVNEDELVFDDEYGYVPKGFWDLLGTNRNFYLALVYRLTVNGILAALQNTDKENNDGLTFFYSCFRAAEIVRFNEDTVYGLEEDQIRENNNKDIEWVEFGDDILEQLEHQKKEKRGVDLSKNTWFEKEVIPAAHGGNIYTGAAYITVNNIMYCLPGLHEMACGFLMNDGELIFYELPPIGIEEEVLKYYATKANVYQNLKFMIAITYDYLEEIAGNYDPPLNIAGGKYELEDESGQKRTIGFITNTDYKLD